MNGDPQPIDPLDPEPVSTHHDIDDPSTIPNPAMPEQHGIKQLKDVVTAGFEVISTAIEVGRDGLDFSDAAALISDADLRNAIQEAVEKADRVDDEVLDLSAKEAVQLVRHVVDEAEATFFGG